MLHPESLYLYKFHVALIKSTMIGKPLSPDTRWTVRLTFTLLDDGHLSKNSTDLLEKSWPMK